MADSTILKMYLNLETFILPLAVHLGLKVS